MRKILGVLFLVATITGCSTSIDAHLQTGTPAQPVKPNPVKPPVVKILPPPPTGFVVSEPKLDEPYPDYVVTIFRQLSGQRTLLIDATARPWLHGDHVLKFDDQLRQANGKWVTFDCDNIADKIIDQNLVKEITPYCAEGHKLGSAYWQKHHYFPNEYVDTFEHRWKRIN